MSISRLIVSTWPAALVDQQTQNNAPAGAELVQTLAGRARWLYEMATGGPAVDTEPAAVPRNPQGLVGHDHSGPPYGTAFRHLLFGCSGGVVDATWSRSPAAFELPNGSTSAFEQRVWIRPHAEQRGAPYSRGLLVLRAISNSGDQSVLVQSGTNGDEAAESVILVPDTETEFTFTSSLLAFRSGWNDLRVVLEKLESGSNLYITGLGVFQTALRSH